MKYHCYKCNRDFDFPPESKEITSKLVRVLTFRCTYCGGTDITLSEHGKLLLERKEKIKKIEKS